MSESTLKQLVPETKPMLYEPFWSNVKVIAYSLSVILN